LTCLSALDSRIRHVWNDDYFCWGSVDLSIGGPHLGAHQEALMSGPQSSQPSPGTFGAPTAEISRRRLLKGAAGLAGLAAMPFGLAACGGSSAAPKPSAGKSPKAVGGSATFGSNYSDPTTKAAFAQLTTNATAATKIQVKINTVDHNTFQQNINNYLQGTPDDLFTWFAGYRLQFFAKQGLLHEIDDVWDTIGANFNDATKSLAKGLDNHYYLVPIYNYPWVVWYNKSTFADKGYTVPATWDDFVALAKKMKTDGLIPLAFADKDGWPALGTFDIINLRVNGYDYHIKLMKHEVPWTDPGVTAVFNQWAEILPYAQQGANGRLWQDAAKALENKKAGMMFQGSNQVAANYAAANLADLDFFPYPAINPTHGQDFMDAPTDGFCVSAKAKNVDAAKSILKYIGTGDAEAAFLKTDAWDVGLAQGLSAPSYNDIQTKAVASISACKSVSQFMDRDTDPGFASNVMIPSIQKFIGDPSKGNIKSLQTSIESQAKSIFTT
jgi:multiple sugar transport system substrate-binding protein